MKPSNPTSHQKFILHYDVLRIVVMLLVVIGHCSYLSICGSFPSHGIDYTAPPFPTWPSRITIVIYSFHMPLFMALSGALYFLTVNRVDFAAKAYVFKRVRRLLLPFILASILLSIPIKFATGYFHDRASIWDIFQSQILGMGNTHLWFLVVLFIIGVIAVALQPIVHRTKWYMVLGVAAGLRLLSIFVLDYNVVMSDFLAMTLKMGVWFYCGYYFEQVRSLADAWLERFSPWKSFLTIIASIAMYVFLAVWIAHYLSHGPLAIYVLFREFLVLLGMVLTYGFCYNLTRLHCFGRLSRSWPWRQMRKYSLDIYLYSDPFNYVVLAVMFYGFSMDFTTEMSSWLLYIIRFAVSLAGAAAVICVVNFAKRMFKRHTRA